jgi:hypothetical protein
VYAYWILAVVNDIRLDLIGQLTVLSRSHYPDGTREKVFVIPFAPDNVSGRNLLPEARRRYVFMTYIECINVSHDVFRKCVNVVVQNGEGAVDADRYKVIRVEIDHADNMRGVGSVKIENVRENGENYATEGSGRRKEVSYLVYAAPSRADYD